MNDKNKTFPETDSSSSVAAGSADQKEDVVSTQDGGPLFPFRYVVIVVTAMGVLCTHSLRTNMSIAIVAMVGTLRCTTLNDTTINNDNLTVTSCQRTGEFDWDEQTRGLILGSLFWGYLITQIPGGWLFDRYGPRWINGLGMMIDGLLTMALPFMARQGLWFLILNRALVGLFQGGNLSSVNSILSKWAPVQERTRLSVIAFTGSQLGTIITLNLAAYLCEHGFAGGWPSVFFVTGGYTIAWSILFMVFVRNRPDESPFVSQAEKQLINSSLKTIANSKRSVPWSHILRSVPFYAIVIAHGATSFGTSIMSSQLPTFMAGVLGFDMKSNGQMTSLGYICTWVSSYCFSVISDRVIKSRKLTTTTVRRIFTVIGVMFPGVIFITLTFIDAKNERNGVLALIYLSFTFGGGIFSGYNCNYAELSPNFAGSVIGIGNSVSVILAIISPYVTGTLINNNNTQEQWNKVFWLSSGIYLCGGIVYAFCSSSKVQYWNDMQNNKGTENPAFDDSENDEIENGMNNFVRQVSVESYN